MSYTEITEKYQVPCTFLDLLQIKSAIPFQWKTDLKKKMNHPKIPSAQGIKIKINEYYKDINEVKCKDFYWHIINSKNHKSTSVHKWSKIYTQNAFQNNKRYENTNYTI